MSSQPIQRILRHLTVRGYVVETHVDDETEEEVYLADHPHRVGMFIRRVAGGLLFWSYFRHSERAQNDLNGFLLLVNQTNRDALVARFFVDADYDLIFEAWHPDRYARDEFDLFLDAWQHDCMLCLSVEGLEEYLI
ncbi:MAG: hypothetical protein KatS3mg109_0492 [Pirellulaceae bacterium]|nr:MAG: hypothetical protein KatS3mg109_0492 [Pirellulaceae bacterium]